MSQKFSNLKMILNRHTKVEKHQKLLKKAASESLIWEKEESRNRTVGMHNARIAYYLLHKGRPDIDFPLLIYINKKNGADVADFSHLHNFVSTSSNTVQLQCGSVFLSIFPRD